MAELLSNLQNKISSYQLFNFIVPGSCLLGILKFLFNINIYVDGNIWWFLLTSYIIGITISRIGSIVIESIFKRIGWIESYDINVYFKKRKDNMLVETMLEIANMYRTLCALCLVLIVVTIFLKNFCQYWHYYLIEILAFILFAISFCKQYNYFTNSLENGNE